MLCPFNCAGTQATAADVKPLGSSVHLTFHMSDIGHPVVGDERYGYETNPIGRLALHAFKLCFFHPVTGELMKFETPYPNIFKSFMLKKKEGRS